MNIISKLQRKVNCIVGKSSSLDSMAYLYRSDGDKGQAFWVYLSELCQMVGCKGLISHEDGMWGLATVGVWKLYVRWMREWLKWRRAECLRGGSVARSWFRVGVDGQARSLLQFGEHVFNRECCQWGQALKLT